ncbi:hypothetical protein ACFC0D_01765 [Streptomyces sp. NPDC056222]|uniref:hypothetical protein n=1 Tax=Streptomyces sp. NPDC056222 TaxID=3345749 RepID=UPI0035E3456A
MDVEQVIEELYGLLPEEFTAARDAYVAEARKAGESDAAKAVSGLRRPTTAAWVSNLFVRARPADVDRLLALGETLREAHRTLDPAKMREASGQRHKVVAALAREAAGPARDAGQPVSDAVLHDVEQIFHAVLADPGIAEQWATGRLVRAPEVPVGFGEVVPEATAPRPEPAKPAKSSKAAKPSKTAAKRVSEADAERRERRERDRAEAEAAATEARARDEALHAAEEERSAALHDVAAADESVTELERQLKEAKEEKRAVQDAAAEAEKAVKEAGRAARDAHRAADRARSKAERSAD